ncbi:MAG: glycosyl hydrolase family 18 protein, partial [candidate division WOR-3 bacterium]
SILSNRIGGYDGIDIDIENFNLDKILTYIALIFELRASLPSEKILSITLQSRLGHTFISRLTSILGWVDEIRVMEYDYHGPWSEPGPIAPYDLVSADLDRFIGPFGIFKKKILLGIPMYAYLWKNSTCSDAGLLSALKIGCEMWASQTQVNPGQSVSLGINISASPAIQWNTTGKCPYFTTRYDTIVHTENVRSISYKMNLAQSKGVRGVCFWQYMAGDGDVRAAKLWDAIKKYAEGTLTQPSEPTADDLGTKWSVVNPQGQTEVLPSNNSEISWTAPSASGTYKLIATLPNDETEIAVADTVEIVVTGGANNPPNIPQTPSGPSKGKGKRQKGRYF